MSRNDGDIVEMVNIPYNFEECKFFEDVKTLLVDRIVYDNFMRCVKLFVLDLISAEEFLSTTSKFLGYSNFEIFTHHSFKYIVKVFSKFAPQYKWMKDRLRNITTSLDNGAIEDYYHLSQSSNYRLLSQGIDESATARKCFPCKEELNDCWKSFPSWQSEDRLSSQKTVYEECVYRTEDERFELDTVIELNKLAIVILEKVANQMSRMTDQDAKEFKLDEKLGANSQVLQVRAIQRVYGDKAHEIIESLMKNPLAVVPLVLKRLKMRELEWIEGRRTLNEIWREQEWKAQDETTRLRWNELKQNDTSLIRSTTFLNEIEILYEERTALQLNNMITKADNAYNLQLSYPKLDSVFQDASELLTFYAEKNFVGSDTIKLRRFLLSNLPILIGAHSMHECYGAHSMNSFYYFQDRCPQELSYIASTFEKTTAYLPEAWYIFFRLHHLLAERLEEFNNRKESDEQYRTLIDLLKKFLTLEIDGQNFETLLKSLNRSMGWKFLIFEKIVVNCFRQLLSILNEEKSIRAYENYVDFYLKRDQFRMCDDDEEEEEDLTSLINDVDMDDLTKYEISAQKLFGSQSYFKTTFHHLDKTVQFEIVPNWKVLQRHQSDRLGTFTKITNNCNNLSDYLPFSRNIEIKRIFLRRYAETLPGIIEFCENSCLSLFESSDLNGYCNRNLSRCKIQLSYDSISENFIFNENLCATMNKNGRLNYISQTYDFLIRKDRRTNAEKINLWRMNRQRIYHFLKWHKNWLNNNVTDEQMEAIESFFTIGFVQPYSNKKSSNCCVLRKISRHCSTRPFSYRRNFYVDLKRIEKIKPTIILDVDK